MEQWYLDYLTSEKWKTKVKARLSIDGYTCQQCGSRGTPTNRLEIHHFHYRTVGNENVFTDLVTLCSNCHKNIHSTLSRITDENGGRMWDKNQQIPKVHIYTISGLETCECIEHDTTNKGENFDDIVF